MGLVGNMEAKRMDDGLIDMILFIAGAVIVLTAIRLVIECGG